MGLAGGAEPALRARARPAISMSPSRSLHPISSAVAEAIFLEQPATHTVPGSRRHALGGLLAGPDVVFDEVAADP